MKFCYVDESGTGDEPYAVMVGVVVDALRMRPTKQEWDLLLDDLSALASRPVEELHTRNFYAGNGPWRDLDGQARSQIIDRILDWLNARKHGVIVCAVEKQKWYRDFPADPRYQDVNTLWRFLGLHLVLAIQRLNQAEPKHKGNTVLIFDNEEREAVRFTDLILKPPPWTDTYYSRERKQDRLDQIVDAPYFADSKVVPLLQVADFVAFLLRRHLELTGGDAVRFQDEHAKVAKWAEKALQRGELRASYPKKGRCACCQLFYDYAPSAIRG